MRVPPIEVAKKWAALYGNADRRGLEFNLSFGDIKKILDTSTCYYSGVPLVIQDSTKPVANGRTVDRIDNTKGYVKGNVVACAHAINQIKNKLLEDEDNSMYIGVATFKKIAEHLEVEYD
jgi:hypothetical protein